MKIRKIRQLLISSCIVLTMLPTYSLAYDSQLQFDENNVATYNQKNYPDLSYRQIVYGGETVGNASCGIFSTLSIIRKEQASKGEELMSVEDMFNKVYNERLVDTSWGHINYERIGEIYPSLKLAENIPDYVYKDDRYFYHFKSTDYDTQIENLKQLLNSNYDVIVCFKTGPKSAHYVSLDYVDPETGDIRITDSGYEGTWISDMYTKYRMPIMYMIIFESDYQSNMWKKSVYTDEQGQKFNSFAEEENRKLKEKEKRIQETKEFKADMEVTSFDCI